MRTDSPSTTRFWDWYAVFQTISSRVLQDVQHMRDPRLKRAIAKCTQIAIEVFFLFAIEIYVVSYLLIWWLLMVYYH